MKIYLNRNDVNFYRIAEAGFKGGQISSSSGSLKTEKPAERPDLIFTE